MIAFSLKDEFKGSHPVAPPPPPYSEKLKSRRNNTTTTDITTRSAISEQRPQEVEHVTYLTLI